MHRNARKKFSYFNKFFPFSLHCPNTRTCCADGKKVIICVSKHILPFRICGLKTRVIYFLYLYIYFWQILCWPFFCVIRTCEGKLCGAFICFRIFKNKIMGVHQAATRLTHQLVPTVAQQCILGRQPN